MIAGILVYLILAAWMGGGMFAAARILRRDDMPLSVRGGERVKRRAALPFRTRPALALLVAVSRGAHRA